MPPVGAVGGQDRRSEELEHRGDEDERADEQRHWPAPALVTVGRGAGVDRGVLGCLVGDACHFETQPSLSHVMPLHLLALHLLALHSSPLQRRALQV